MRELRGALSGLAQPTYVLDIPGGYGKVPVGPDYLRREGAGHRVTDPAGREHAYPRRGRRGRMMRRLWGRANSVNVQKVVWALEELDLPYERVEAGGAHGIVDDASYRAMNPNGLVPTLQEDGFVLWESNAILRYLALSQGGVLTLPEAPRERARIDQWLDWQATAFTPAMRDAFWQLLRVPEGKRDTRAINASRRATEPLAALLDRHLAGTPFVAGEHFGIADIAVGCAAHRWLNLPLEREDRPHVARWLAGLAQRPAAASVLRLPIS